MASARINALIRLARKRGAALDAFFKETILPRLEQYAWPGNVRELESVMERYFLLKTLWEEDTSVEERIKALLGLPPEALASTPRLPAGRDLREMVETVEYELVRQVLHECGNDQAAAAKRLGIGKTTLWRKLQAGKKD